MNNLTNKLLVGMMFLIIIMSVVLAIVWHQSKQTSDDYDAFKIAMSNKIKTYQDANGNLITQATAAKFDKSADFQDAIKQLNAAGANVLSKIDNRTQGLILLTQKVGGQITGNTQIGKLDTVKDQLKTKSGRDSLVIKVYPEYTISDTAKSRYYSIFGTVGPKKYILTPSFIDSTELKPTMIKNGFFKKSVLGVESLNHNPFVKTTGLKYLELEKKPAPVWKVLGIIALLGGGIFIGHKL